MVNDKLSVISPYSKIKVYWDDQPHNYSKAGKIKIRNYFANKYGVNKNNINVIYRAVKKSENGDVIEISGAGIENIMDVNYQRALMKELIERDKKDIDFDRIIALDEKVNAELTIDVNDINHKSWSIKWLMVDNFLSFGDKNYIPFNKLKGLTIVNSIPANQGGKTTLTIDAIKFLLHGNTTKTDTNEQIFNTFSGKDELVVRGMIEIEGEETIIERKMKRTAKKSGGWTISNRVNYYQLMPDGEEKELNEENAIQTTKLVRETIGSEKDFEMLVLATEKNLDDLIGLTTTESGKILTRLIGLEVLEMKEAAVRVMYNEFSRKKKSNEYDVITLTDDINNHNVKIENGDLLEAELNVKLETTKAEIKTLTTEKEQLFNDKEKIDVSITELRPEKLEAEIESLIAKGVSINTKTDELKLKVKEIGVVSFDEDAHFNLTKDKNQRVTDETVMKAETTRLGKVIAGLIAGGVCQSCNRKLDDVDNTEHIAKHEKEVENLLIKIEDNRKILDEIIIDIAKLDIVKKVIDEKNKLELDIARAEVELGSLRNSIVEKRNDLKKYKLNLDAIELNRKIDIQVINVKTKLAVSEFAKEQTITNIERVKADIITNKSQIATKEKLIETIKKEEEVEKIFKVYIDLVGKKGISKLVLRSVLPIINSEVQRLLEDVVDFDVEIFMNEKNDVQFLIVKDETSKLLKSGSGLEKTTASLALRAVLGKISTLPMPNFITFDEVLGKIAPENFEKLKLLFDKIKDMYEIVFFITHNDMVKDWANTTITVIKEDNISKVTIS